MDNTAVDQSSYVFTKQRRTAYPAAVRAPVAPEQLSIYTTHD